MKKNIIIAATIIVASLAVAYYISMIGSEVAIHEKYPEIDQKIAIKAHRKMLRRAYTGAYNDIELNEETLDQIFRSIVKEISE